MKIIVLTNQWPRSDQPYCGIVVVRQVESLRRAGVEVEVISISGEIRSYLKAAMTVLRMNVAPRRAALLHAHTGHAGVLACLQLRYPVVLTYIGYDIDDQLEQAQRVRRRSEQTLFRLLAGLMAATIVQSKRSAGQLPRLARRRSQVIPNGVDRQLFSPLPLAEARRRLGWGQEPTVLFAADPQRHVKRFELAQAAVDLARRSVPDLRLMVADQVSPEAMPVWMSAADVLLLTSRSEGSPNVVKEAMACDLPIVSVDVGDVPEVIGGTRNCHICVPEAEALATAVGAVIARRPDRSDGRERTAWLAEELVTGQLLGVYRSVRGRRPGALGFLSRRPQR